jgi:hypothetical protein
MTRRANGASLRAVAAIVRVIIGAMFAGFRPRASLVPEHLALRQQLAVLRRATPRPRLRPLDQAFWIVLSRTWSRWRELLAIVKPATVIAWHRRGFARFWAKKSRPVGRPPLADEVVALIERMSRDNPLWSRRRIASELAKLGHDVDKHRVAKYMPKPAERPVGRAAECRPHHRLSSRRRSASQVLEGCVTAATSFSPGVMPGGYP